MDATDVLLRIAGCEQPDRQADVIFVHGLDGDARTTWHPKGQPERFWPAWLGEDLQHIGVWSLNYAVSSSAWKGHSMPLYDRADNTLDLFELEGIGQRPIAFICHSLGGLLIKQALRNAKDSPNPHWQAIIRQTKLIVFLSTPHSGASMASWIQYVGKLLRTTVSVEELEAHHPRLRELNDWYRDHVEALGITTFVYYEKLSTAGIRVVDDTTANPGIAGVRPIPVDEDHVSICKPASKGHRIYRRVKRLVEENILSGDTVSQASLDRDKEDAIGPDKQPIEVPRGSTDTTPASPVETTHDTGQVKLTVCQRLVQDWRRLADYVGIRPDERARFSQGYEPQGVWEWLEARNRLAELPDALVAIGRDDLVEELRPHPPR